MDNRTHSVLGYRAHFKSSTRSVTITSPKRPHISAACGGRKMETSVIKKRSICVAGHKTSISLEDEFWQSLREIADEREETVAQLIAGIDTNREFANLSSAIRLFILRYYRDQLDQEDRTVTAVAPPNGSQSIEIS